MNYKMNYFVQNRFLFYIDTNTMETTITEEKTFQVPVSALYKAWTEEEELKNWWKPGGRTLSSLDAELEEGGTLKYTFETLEESNGNLVIDGEYREVLPEEKLVYTWNWSIDDAPVENGEYQLTVEFSGEGDASKLHITQENTGGQEAIHPHKEGWDKALAELDAYLSQKN